MQTATKTIETAARPVMRSLESGGPYSELKDKLMLFGQFAGNWEYESRYFLHDGKTARAKGEIHFGWILGGTAIQDVMTGGGSRSPAWVSANWLWDDGAILRPEY